MFFFPIDFVESRRHPDSGGGLGACQWERQKLGENVKTESSSVIGRQFLNKFQM